jgi:hypothetical protein
LPSARFGDRRRLEIVPNFGIGRKKKHVMFFERLPWRVVIKFWQRIGLFSTLVAFRSEIFDDIISKTSWKIGRHVYAPKPPRDAHFWHFFVSLPTVSDNNGIGD